MSEDLSRQLIDDRFSGENEGYFRDKPDGALDPAGEAGWFLQREREKRGLSLDEIGEATGIHPYHVEAIEFGDMTHMPARLEALEMIGSYAQYLGFDPEPLLIHYARFLPRPAMAPASHPANPAPLTSAKVLRFAKLPKFPRPGFRLNALPGGTGGLIASVAAAVFLFAGAGWIMMPGGGELPAAEQNVATSTDPMPTASTQAEPAEIKVTEEPMPDDQPVAAVTPPAPPAEPGTDLNGLTALIEQSATTSEVPTAIEAAAPTKAAANEVATVGDVGKNGEAREFGIKNEASRLVLKAKAPVWVRIEDSEGNVVMTQMLMKGDTYRVPDRDGLVVIARDGGLLSYLIDGKEKGILGTPGEILVGRSLDLKALEGSG